MNRRGSMAALKKKILVIEDDSIMGMEMKEVLEGFGYEVSGVVTSGDAGISEAKKTKPDLILLDIRLKGSMSGIEVARAIRLFTNAPITFLTGYKNESTVSETQQISGSYMLTKPVDFDELNNTLQKAIEARP